MPKGRQMALYSASNPLGEVSRPTSELVERCYEHFDEALFEPNKMDRWQKCGLTMEHVGLGDHSSGDTILLFRNDVRAANQATYPFWAQDDFVIAEDMDTHELEDYCLKYPIDAMGNIHLLQQSGDRRVIMDAPESLALRVQNLILNGKLIELVD